MSSVVLDASAVLAVAKFETGAEAVTAERIGAILSAVNHTEVVSKLLRHGLTAEEIERFLVEVFPNVIAFDREQANLAAKLHAENKQHKLSYADCSCLALAMVQGIPVLTGDRKWTAIRLDVEVRLFR